LPCSDSGQLEYEKVERRQQVPILHVISREYYAMYATQLLLTSQVCPMLMSSVPHVPFLNWL